jgi:cyclopropane fatty-acyl-phospholipid synthase-like methyltransferase
MASAGTSARTTDRAKTATSPRGSERPRARRLMRRLSAWWDGVEAAEDMAAQTASCGAAPIPDAPQAETDPEYFKPDDSAWSPARLAAAELILGADCRSPFPTWHVLDMVKPLALDSSKTLLDLSAGMGEAARAITEKFGVWVTALDPSRVLAKEGMKRSTEADLAKKAPVQSYNTEALELPERAFDCVLAREVFYTVREKNRLYEVIFNTMKSAGEMVFTDYVLREPGLDTPDLRAWMESEPVTPHLWTKDQHIHALRRLIFEVRTAEDVTAPYRDMIVSTLDELRSNKALWATARQTGETFMNEVELWARRAQVLESGDLQVYRFFVRKPVMDDGRMRTMSNW